MRRGGCVHLCCHRPRQPSRCLSRCASAALQGTLPKNSQKALGLTQTISVARLEPRPTRRHTVTSSHLQDRTWCESPGWEMQHRNELPPPHERALCRSMRAGQESRSSTPGQGAGHRAHGESLLQMNLDPGLDPPRLSFQRFLLLGCPDLVQS